MFRLDNKVAIITGGSRGIGRAIAQTLARQGAHVVINYRKEQEQAEQLVQALKAEGMSAEAVGFDVTDSKAVDAAMAEVIKQHGRLDVLVANAGIAIDGLLLRVRDEDLEQMFAVNLRGALACARAAVRTMMRAKAGRVVFVSSIVGEMGNAGQSAYAATKAAVLGAMRTLAREYASRGITFNAVSPGLIDTDMISNFDQEARKAVAAQIPLGRIGLPADVAAAVAYLCSDEAGYVTGQVLRVNGGMHM